MNIGDKIQSTIDANNQISKQIGEGHHCLHVAYIGRGRNWSKSGFTDFTLFYQERAKEEFSKKIKEEPRSNNYVEVNYYVDSTRIRTWKYLTMEEYLNLPQTWKEFKKLLK